MFFGEGLWVGVEKKIKKNFTLLSHNSKIFASNMAERKKNG